MIEKTVSLGLWGDALGYPVKQTGTGAGLSLRLGNWFYLGYSREARFVDDYKWEENFLGLAVYQPKSFRAEYSELRKDDPVDGSGIQQYGDQRNRISWEFYTSELF
ncbi:MAG: hypothetical protein RRB13_02185 [bacterium]|nr:hypothetical protein [bacterium]